MTDRTNEPLDSEPCDCDQPDCVHRVHTDHVAVPEVRTGQVDVEGDFEKEQDRLRAEQARVVSFDTVAVPEYHTGKCPPQCPDCEEDPECGEEESDGKDQHTFLGDLVRTLVNGSAD